MVSPNQDPQREHESHHLSPAIRNPLDTSFRNNLAYRGAEMQQASRQLARLAEKIARHYEVIDKMPTTHILLGIPNLLANQVAPLVTLTGVAALATGRVFLGATLLTVSLGLRLLQTDPLPLEEYGNLIDAVAKARAEFLAIFKDPLKASLASEAPVVGPLAIEYAIMGIRALTPQSYYDSLTKVDSAANLKRACYLFDLSFDPFDFTGPAIIKSEVFAADVKTLRLLSSLFDSAGDFSLNGFESERARFEENVKRLQQHLETVAAPQGD